MNKILIVAGLTLVAVVFFILGMKLMLPSDETNDQTVTTPAITTEPEVKPTPTAVEPIISRPNTPDEGVWFDAIQDPQGSTNTWLFSVNESVSVALQDCKDDIFATKSPFTVDFGDGSSAPVETDHTGYAIEGGYCSLFWEVSHEYTTAGTYTVNLIRDGGTVSTREVVLESDLR